MMTRRRLADGAMAPAAVVVPNDNEPRRHALDENELKLIGHDNRKALEEFQAQLQEAIRGTRKRAQRDDYLRLQGRVIERLETLDNRQMLMDSAQVALNLEQEDSSKRERTDAHQPTALLPPAQRLKTSTRDDNHQNAQQLTGTAGTQVAGLATADEEKVDDETEDDDDDEDNEDDNDGEMDTGIGSYYDGDYDEVVSVEKQAERATKQLISLLHQRLGNTKQRIYNFLALQVHSYLTDEVNSSLNDVRTAIVIGLSLTDLQPMMDQALSRTGIQQTAPGETNEIDLMMDNAQATEPSNLRMNVISEIQAVANESDRFPDIFTSLAQHRVKPYFHTLFFPETFLNNRRSAIQVTPGLVDDDRPVVEFDEFGEKLDEVVAVDKSGIARGARFIIDDGMESPQKWKFSDKHTAFAVELVNTEAEMLGEGVERTTITSSQFQINDEDDVSQLFTRPESRGIVRDIFCQFTDPSKRAFAAAITGLPGIGKSWTLFYALQQALLYNGANVLFFYKKKSRAVMYLRRDDKVYAWTSKSKATADSNLFERPDVLVLLDPKEADRGGAQYESGKRKLLYAASNNEVHISATALKNSPNMLAFLGPPLDNELPVILRFLEPTPTLTKNVIWERKASVGNLIRYILTEKQYENRVAAIQKAVNRCKEDPILLDKALEVDAMSDAQQTISGTLFKILPKRPIHPGSMGYDGQGVEYHERVVEAANAKVRSEILTAKRKTILAYLGKTSYDEFAKMGNKAEELFIHDLTKSDGMVVNRYLQKSGRNQTGGQGVLSIENGMLVPDVAIRGMRKICDAVLKEPKVVAKVATGTPLIDAAGPGRKVYQVTISPDHEMSLNAMEKLAKGLGYIREDGTIAPEDETTKLEFHWVVPIGIAPTWIKKAPRKYLGSKKDSREVKDRRELLNRVLATHVDQYILPMTYDTPTTFLESVLSGKTAREE